MAQTDEAIAQRGSFAVWRVDASSGSLQRVTKGRRNTPRNVAPLIGRELTVRLGRAVAGGDAKMTTLTLVPVKGSPGWYQCDAAPHLRFSSN